MGRHAVRIKTDSGWEELGKTRYPGVEPSAPQVQSDPAGFASVSFALSRPDVHLPQPDLAHSAECEIDFDGIRVFEGRISEAPVSGPERLVNVQGRGWQYALDENPIIRSWVAADLADWKDARQFVGARIYRSGVTGDTLGGGGVVTPGDGQVVIGYPQGVPWPAGAQVGITQDFGPDPDRWPAAIELYMKRAGAPTTVRMNVRAHDKPGDFSVPVAPDAAVDGLGTQPFLSALGTANLAYAAEWALRRRYVSIYLVNTGATYTPTVDDTVAISNVRSYRQTTFRGGGDSDLRASSVAADVYALTPGLATPTTEPELFANEASAHPLAWWMRGANADALGIYTPAVVGAPIFGQSPGPLVQAEPSAFATFDGVDDGMAFTIGSPGGVAWFSALSDITLFILFRTTATPPAGVTWPNGKGLLDAYLSTDANNSYGLQLVAGGKVSGGAANGAATPTPVVNDGRWHTAALRRRRQNAAGLSTTTSVIDVIVDGTVVASTTHSTNGGAALTALTVYLAHNHGGGGGVAANWLAVDVAEAFQVFGAVEDEALGYLHSAALARVRGTVKRTLLVLPSYAPPAGQAKVSRGHVDDVNLYHRYRVKVGRDRTPWFYPQPSTPMFALTDDAVERFTDTSMSAAAESYNRALILGTRPDGRGVAEYRYSAGLAGAKLARIPGAFANPAAEADASGWTVESSSGAGTPAVTRITSGQISGAGSFQISAMGAWTSVRQPFAVDVEEDTVYVVGLTYRVTDGELTAGDYLSVYDVASGVNVAVYSFEDVANVFPFTTPRALTIPFAVPTDKPAGTLALRVAVGDAVIRFDDLWLAGSQHHRLDRLGQLRTRTVEFGESIDVPTARILADAFLQSKLRTPFAGSLPIGPGDLVTYGPSPLAVSPAVLCDNVGELVHFPGLIDPDGGGQGRDGQIVSVSFDCATERAEVSFDNTRDNFEALMARGALFRGGAS